MPQAKKLQHRITVGHIQVVTETGMVPAYWAHPQYGGPFPGLILLHDDRGLSPHMRSLVQRFAEVGYYVIAPDLFEGQHPANDQQAQVIEGYHLPQAPQKVAASLAALESHHKCNKKMAVIGWDFGGTLVFDIAVKRADVMAAVSFYGNPMPFFGQFNESLSPILAIFGQFDEIIRAQENQLREELLRTGKPHEVIIYPDAQHNFYNDALPTYNPEAAEDAWRQTLAFLETYQGKPPVPDSAKTSTLELGRFY